MLIAGWGLGVDGAAARLAQKVVLASSCGARLYLNVGLESS